MTSAAQYSDRSASASARPSRQPAQAVDRSWARDRLQRRILALTLLLAGAWLMSMAWPRLQAGVHFLPVDTAIRNYYDSRVIPSSQLDALIAQAQGSIERHAHYRYYDGLSFLHYLRALDPATPGAERRRALLASVAAAEEALARAPAKPATWLRVAQSRAALREDEYAILPPLEMSILTGRVEPTLLLSRLELGLRYLPGLEAETANLLRDQAILTWRLNPRGLLRALREGRVDPDRLRELLGPAGSGLAAELEAALQSSGGNR
jgi:hypothetical protein